MGGAIEMQKLSINVGMHSVRVGLVLCAVAAALALAVPTWLSRTFASAGASSQSGFAIRSLSGSLVRISSSRYVAYGVRIRAIVCFRTSAGANSYPSAITIGHYLVQKSRWWDARTVIDHAPWLVPFGEGWHGARCGPVLLEDPIPSDHYGVESIGNRLGCYGISLMIQVGGDRASRRAIVTCGRRFG
jgi:hypothetical protein